MTKALVHNVEWAPPPPGEWARPRLKELFLDDSANITVNQMETLEVDHYSIPSYDEGERPTREAGSAIASNKVLLRGGELLYSKLNCHKPRAWLVPTDDRTKVASTEFIALREWHAGSTCLPFLRYVLGSAVFADYMACFQTSVTNSHKRISPRDLFCTRAGLPSLREQERIARSLDRSCKAIDEAIAAKRAQLAQLDGVKRDAIQTAITRGIGERPALRTTDNTWIAEVPEKWGLVSLKRVAEIHSGLTLGKEYDGPLVERPYLRVANVQDGHLDLTEVTSIEVPLAVAHRLTLRVGDVLMTEGGDLDKLGRGTLWNGEVPDCLHQNHIFAVRCFTHKLVPAFLAYLTASQYGRDYFEATGKKTTNLAATNSTKVGQFPIPLPPLGEQQAICAHLDDKLAHLKEVTACIQGQIDVLTDYRKSLIHEYVTGQRRVPVEQEVKAVAYG